MLAAKVQILPLRRSSPSHRDIGSAEQALLLTNAGRTPSPPQKRTRISKPKVRSGCVTCKIRRVKCDEAKPECNRCTGTGRKCDGYSIPPRKNKTTSIPKSLNPASEIPAGELRALDFFHHKTAPALSSYFDADFWARVVFQTSYVEPAIRHALVAVGAFHEQRERNARMVPMSWTAVVRGLPLTDSADLPRRSGEEDDRFAFNQYTRAVAHLTRRMDDSSTSIEVALISCILFVCIEFLRGDAQLAVRHFKSGMGIALDSLSSKDVSTASGTMQRIKEGLLPILNRIELLSLLFGNQSQWDYPVDLFETVPETFTTLREARDSITHVINLTLRFMRRLKFHRYGQSIPPADYVRQEALLSQLDAWSSRFDEMLLSGSISKQDLDTSKILRIHQLVAKAWLKRVLEPEESANDAMMAEFETTVSLAEGIQSIAETDEGYAAPTRSTFLFDMEFISPLYYIGTRCRHPQIRRRAIALLKKTRRREGLWDSNMAAAIAECVMAHEESDLTTLDGSELPAEANRVHQTQIRSETGVNPRHHRVTFYSMPDGIDGPFKVWTEQISLPAVAPWPVTSEGKIENLVIRTYNAAA